ncbi:MAG: MerR family transcriptional regulator [Candidatus Dadabacteria bacterium]|nr:MerR family transcriptional regulator [Candidatus Dadabacteria bacterium]NIQ13902.1 MerR family transcriptional regulator [Candidatus Dadabacteria bacterium]
MQEKALNISLPDKIYFRIGEVSEYTGVKPYVLRYWESEFDQIKPIRRKSQRLYDRDTIYLIFKIKHMLYEQNFTIAGAKKKLREEESESKVPSVKSDKQFLRDMLNELKSLKNSIS